MKILTTFCGTLCPQASLTQGLLGPEVARLLKPRETIAGLFDEACDADMADLVRPIAAVPGVSLVAGSGRMDRFNALEPWTTGDSQYILRDALREVSGDFDLTLIDCPPHIYLCAWSAMVAAQGIVVPVACSGCTIRRCRTVNPPTVRVESSEEARWNYFSQRNSPDRGTRDDAI